MNRMIVHIAESKDFSPEVIQRIKEVAEVKIQDISPDQLKESLQECDVFWFRLAFKIDASVLSPVQRCKFLMCPVTGLDHINLALCEQYGVRVISLHGETNFLEKVRATAELTLGLALSLLRKIPHAAEHTRAGQWNRNLFKGSEIYDKTVGIVGLGRLGKIVGGYFSAMGANVIGFDTQSVPDASVEVVSSLQQLISRSDIVSLHVSLNETSKHLINHAALAWFKKEAILINTSRGAVVDSMALVNALQKEALKGAAVDVIEQEFDVHSDPLVQYAATHSNLLLTPHIGGNTIESFRKTEMFLWEKFKKIISLK